MEALLAIINSSFDKLSLIFGVVLIMVSVFCAKPIVFWKIQLPDIDAIGRGIAAFVGLILLALALFAFIATAKVGLFSTPPTEEGNRIGAIFRIISNVYASENTKITIQQHRPKVASLPSGEKIIVLAGNIKAVKPSHLALFRSNGDVQQLPKLMTYTSLLEKMGFDQLIFEGSVVQEGTYTFEYNKSRYSLRVDEVLWYLFGSDYMRISITKTK